MSVEFSDIATTQHCLSVRFVGVSSPPVQCSNTGLEMGNKKCWVVHHISNTMSENPSDVLKSKDIWLYRALFVDKKWCRSFSYCEMPLHQKSSSRRQKGSMSRSNQLWAWGREISCAWARNRWKSHQYPFGLLQKFGISHGWWSQLKHKKVTYVLFKHLTGLELAYNRI